MPIKKITVIWSIIAELIVLIVGVISTWTNDGNINTFDIETLKITLVLCIIFAFAVVVRIYPTVKRLSNESKRYNK